MVVPDQEPVTPVQDLVNDALSHRAELSESRIDLVNRDINNKSAKNALLPTLSAFAYYGGSGVGGNVNPNVPLCSATSTGFCVNPADIPPTFKSGNVSYGGAFGQLFDSTAPDKGAGLQLTIPLRNRAAWPPPRLPSRLRNNPLRRNRKNTLSVLLLRPWYFSSKVP
jgi:hypothetical protein